MNPKETLLSAVAGLNRGLLATEAEKATLLGAIVQVEDTNPTPNPLERADLLDGNWRLLYTTSQELLGFDRLPLLQPGQIYQTIRASDRQVVNVAEIVGLPFCESLVAVVANFEVESPSRAQVTFKRSILGLQRFLQYDNLNAWLDRLADGQTFGPLDFDIGARNRSGWLEITYLDSDLRIGRGNAGSVFVLTKV